MSAERVEDELRALLIEDNPADARLLELLVSECSTPIALKHVLRLSEGLEFLREDSYDVVLLDLSLPDAQGIETVTRTHVTAPEVAIIVLTGLNDEKAALKAVHEGAQDYLVKGQFDGNLLLRAIRYAMERKRTEESARSLIREQSARASAEAAERRSRFLSEASRALSSSLDYDTTLASAAALAVPMVADCCFVDLSQENGRIRRVGAIAPNGMSPELWREEPRDMPTDPEDPVGRVLRGGEVGRLAGFTEPVHQAMRIPERWRNIQPRSALLVPLHVRNRILGAMTFIAAQSGRRRGRDDLLALEFASRAALALDNARLYRAREQILEVVSHGLRTPLSTMLGNLALIRDSDVEPRGPLELISRSAQHMSRLIEDLLDMGRIEAGTFVLDQQPLEVSVLLDEVSRSLRPAAESRGQKLQVAVAEGLPLVHADRRRILQVFWNLVSNGLKLAPTGGTVDLSARAQDREVRFDVVDSGPGMPEKELARVFEPYGQGAVPSLRGEGLGLSLAKAVVEAHGGKIGATSSSSGTTFFFTLPRVGERKRISGAAPTLSTESPAS